MRDGVQIGMLWGAGGGRRLGWLIRWLSGGSGWEVDPAAAAMRDAGIAGQAAAPPGLLLLLAYGYGGGHAAVMRASAAVLSMPGSASTPDAVLELCQREQDVLSPDVVVARPQGLPAGETSTLRACWPKGNERGRLVGGVPVIGRFHGRAQAARRHRRRGRRHDLRGQPVSREWNGGTRTAHGWSRTKRTISSVSLKSSGASPSVTSRSVTTDCLIAFLFRVMNNCE